MSLRRVSAVLPLGAVVAFLWLRPALASQTPASLHTATAPALRRSWSIRGSWAGAASDDRRGTIFALDKDGKCLELNSYGKALRRFSLSTKSGTSLRILCIPGGKDELVTFTEWPEGLRAFDLHGRELWSYPELNGIDDVWALNAGPRNPGEVVVGYNGFSGLHVLDSRGKTLWKTNAIGNVWHVCAGDVLDKGKPQIITTSAIGQVHVFSGEGTSHKDLDPGFYAYMVRVAVISRGKSIILAGGAGEHRIDEHRVIVAALSGNGRTEWSDSFPAASAFVTAAVVARTKPWIALATNDGAIYAINVINGKVLGIMSGQGSLPEMAWARAESGKSPLLVVATGSKLSGFRVPAPSKD